MGYPKIKHITVEIIPKITDLINTVEYLPTFRIFCKVKSPTGEVIANTITRTSGTITNIPIQITYG